MADSSLLGSVPRDYGHFIERSYAAEDRNKALAGKLQQQHKGRDDTRIQKYLHDIDIGDKVHRWYGDAARENMAGLMSDIEEAKHKYGEYNYMNHLGEAVSRRLNVAKDLVRKSGPLKAEEKFYESHGDQYTEPQKQMLQEMQIGTMDNARKIQDPMGTVNMNEQGEINFAKRLPTKFDIKKRASDFLDGLAKSNGSQIVSNVELPGTNGKRAIETGTFLPETPEDARAAEDKVFQETGKQVTFTDKQTALKEQFKGDPAIQAWYGEANRDRYTKDSPLDFKDPKSNWKETMADDYFNDHKGYGGQSFKRAMIAPVKATSSGYNHGSGEGSNDRFNTAPLTDGSIGHDLKYIGTDETKPKAIFTSPYALKGDATNVSDDYAGDWNGKQEGFLAGHRALTNPKTGMKEMFFVITKGQEAARSETNRTKLSDTESKSVSSKDKSPIRTWLIPATRNEAQASDFAKDKKGNNPYMVGYKDDLRKMREENAVISAGKTEKVAKSKEERRSKMKNIFAQ